MSAHLKIFKLYLKTNIQTVVVFSFISSSVVCFILCPANESFCEWRYSFEFVVLTAQLTTPYRQKPYAWYDNQFRLNFFPVHISQRVGSHFNRGAETAEKEGCASVQGLLRASHNLVNNQICKRFWFVGHPNVCLVSYFGLPCSNKASFDRNLKKKQMYTMENGKMMRGQQNPIKIPENVFPPTHSSSPSPQFEAPT